MNIPTNWEDVLTPEENAERIAIGQMAIAAAYELYCPEADADDHVEVGHPTST